jgi:RNA polymerase sigma-70 factor (ECF subfamily)
MTSARQDIEAAYATARARPPEIAIGLDVFQAALVERIAGGATASDVHAADLLLGLGCLRGDRHAIAAFEQLVLPDASRALARLGLDRAAIDDLLQHVRAKVLVGDDGTPALARYGARGPLAGWTRAIAVHAAMSRRRAQVRRGVEESVSVLSRMPVRGEPEIAHLREAYAAPFKAAFGEALASLAPRDRNVLRLVYLDGLTAEQVGLAYGVHRVSVARWLGQIREALFKGTRRLLEQRLALSPADVQSLTRLCLSQLDLSLDRLLVELDEPASS